MINNILSSLIEQESHEDYNVKIVDDGLDFYFHSSFFYFIFLFLEQLGLGPIGHAVTSDGIVT